MRAETLIPLNDWRAVGPAAQAAEAVGRAIEQAEVDLEHIGQGADECQRTLPLLSLTVAEIGVMGADYAFCSIAGARIR